MKKVKLCQIVAVEKDTRGRAMELLKKLQQVAAHGELFEGFRKEWEPLSEDGERYEPEERGVQFKADEVVREVLSAQAEDISVEATKDCGNAASLADITVDGVTLVENAPVPLLLFLEKRLALIHSAISGLPERDPARRWAQGDSLALSDTVRTHRTKKTQRPIVLYDATPEHPAQTQLVTEDAIVGHWVTTYVSGAFSEMQKKQLLGRVERLIEAVKFAREEANSRVVDRLQVGGRLMEFVIGDTGQAKA